MLSGQTMSAANEVLGTTCWIGHPAQPGRRGVRDRLGREGAPRSLSTVFAVGAAILDHAREAGEESFPSRITAPISFEGFTMYIAAPRTGGHRRLVRHAIRGSAGARRLPTSTGALLATFIGVAVVSVPVWVGFNVFDDRHASPSAAAMLARVWAACGNSSALSSFSSIERDRDLPRYRSRTVVNCP